MMDNLLEVKDLKISEYKRRAYNDIVGEISLYVKPGEIVGLAGESGCGKSLTCRAIMNILPSNLKITNGEIRYLGKPIDYRDKNLYGKEISMIFQEPTKALHPLKTVGNQISEVLKLHSDIRGAKLKKKVIEALEMVGIDEPETRYKQYPHQLSGGLCQRVIIAIATIMKPSLIIADEPTTSLDVTVQKKILDLLLELNKKMGTSIIFISHDLAVLSHICNRVYVMYCGEIVEEGMVPGIFASPYHPYNKALISSIPSMYGAVTKLKSIKGMVPSPRNYSKYCRFYDRCEERCEACKDTKPQLKDVNGRGVRCVKFE